MDTPQFTYFAPAERLPLEDIINQSRLINKLHDIRELFDSFPNVIILINHHRQIIFCNKILLNWLNISDFAEVLGLRPGEVLGCINAYKMPGGCGTSEACYLCGAVQAILASQDGDRVYKECRITIHRTNKQESLELGITCSPLHIENEQFTVLFMEDISSIMRRQALEHIFFHDIMNTASSILAVTELIKVSKDPEEVKDLLSFTNSAAKQLVEEIEEQRDLLMAENNELVVDMARVNSLSVLIEAAERYIHDEFFRGIEIQMDPASDDVIFNSNKRLLRRIICNMLKNALEAAAPGERVRLGCRLQNGHILFWVNNPGVMPREIQLQVFQRSFSTKHRTRGLGTYSMKLLTERYLGGKISFAVSEEEGTTFYASYPAYL